MVHSMGFDPARSQVTADEMMRWLRSPITGELTEVPGIGPVNEKHLRAGKDGKPGIETTHQLFAAFLALKGASTTPEQHLQAFWEFLAERGVTSHRSGIVDAVAAKLNVMLPSIQYDAASFHADKQQQQQQGVNNPADATASA